MKRTWHQQFKRKPKEARTSPDGITHDSVSEKERWCKLQFDERLGLVRNLRRQVAYPLQIDAVRAVKTPTGRIAKYTPDFVYERFKMIDLDITSVKDTAPRYIKQPAWVEVIEDSKGYMDKVAELRIAIFEAIYQKKVEIYKG